MIESSFWRHYKGNNYYVHFAAKDSETKSESIVYQEVELLPDEFVKLIEGKIWHRSSKDFYGIVQIDGKATLRFTPLYLGEVKLAAN